MDRRQHFHLESTSNGKTKVIENSTGLIWRTLDTRAEAAEWAAQADPSPVNRKVKTR